jgi:hypothetical protein
VKKRLEKATFQTGSWSLGLTAWAFDSKHPYALAGGS